MGRKKKSDYPERLERLIAACNGLALKATPDEVWELVDWDNEHPVEGMPQSVLDFIYWDDHNIEDENPDKTISVSRSQRRPAVLWADVARLYDDKQMLRRIVRAFDEYREIPDPDISSFRIDPLYISFLPDSTVTLVSSRVLDILIQHKVPVERIRICSECNDLYLARRSGTTYCSKRKCQTAYSNRVRALRRDREELNVLRNEYRIKLEELKSCTGTSTWKVRKRESLERELVDIKTQGLKIRKRVEERLHKEGGMNSYGGQP